MENATNFNIDIIYFRSPEQPFITTINISPATTIAEAITQSELLSTCPELELNTLKVGMFGKRFSLDHQLNINDRIEIYRPLLIDPKTARRKRAKMKQ